MGAQEYAKRCRKKGRNEIFVQLTAFVKGKTLRALGVLESWGF